MEFAGYTVRVMGVDVDVGKDEELDLVGQKQEGPGAVVGMKPCV